MEEAEDSQAGNPTRLSKPLVSVIIPTRNRKDLVGKAINSAIKQEGVSVDIIIVNDGSNDATETYISENFPSVNLINIPESVGGAKARNIGAERATGEYIAFLDSDDEWLPNHLLIKTTILEKLEADGVYSTFFLNEDGKRIPIVFGKSFPVDFKIADKISSYQIHDARTSTFVFRRDAFLNIRFDNALKKHQDWDLAINFEKVYRLIEDNNPTVIIHVDALNKRMSNNLNHNATLYFLNKNKQSFQLKSLFIFCTKMIMRCQAIGDRRAIGLYLQLMYDTLPGLSIKDRLLYTLIKYNVINLNKLRLVKNRLTLYLTYTNIKLRAETRK